MYMDPLNTTMSPKQEAIIYLLGCLQEEAAEVTQETVKIRRFGAHHVCPVAHTPNLSKLVNEWGDLVGIQKMLAQLDPIYKTGTPVTASEFGGESGKLHRYMSDVAANSAWVIEEADLAIHRMFRNAKQVPGLGIALASLHAALNASGNALSLFIRASDQRANNKIRRTLKFAKVSVDIEALSQYAYDEMPFKETLDVAQDGPGLADFMAAHTNLKRLEGVWSAGQLSDYSELADAHELVERSAWAHDPKTGDFYLKARVNAQ